MDRSRFEFLKKIASHFRENPDAKSYLGVSRQTCYSVLALHFSTPTEILDPTAEEFPAQIEKKVDLFEQNHKQNVPFPKTIDLPQELDETTQKWQDEENKPQPPSQAQEVGRFLERKLKNSSSRALKKAGLKTPSRIRRFLSKSKLLKKVGGFLKAAGKLIGGIGIVLAVAAISLAIIQKAIKYIGSALYLLYLFFASIGGWAFAGAIAGGIVGGIGGGIAGGILGFKLGVILGSPLLAIPVVGWALYGILVTITTLTGVIVGALGGAFVGAAVLGSVMYALEHWVWNPIQGALTGAPSFFAGLWSGFWTGAGGFLNGALSWAGSTATAAGNFAAGFFSSLSSISLAPAVGVPVLGTIGVATVGTFFISTFVVGASFMNQPTKGVLPPVSKYATVNKVGSFTKIGDPINYTLTITAGSKSLSNVRITDNTTLSCTAAPPSVSPKTLGPYSILPGSPLVLTYQTPTTNQFQNCSVNNTATVVFDVPDDSVTGQKAITSFALTIGSPPATGCPIISGTISCGSYNAGCHCRPGYPLVCSSTKIYTAADIVGPSGLDTYSVYLPSIFGENLQWKYVGEGVSVPGLPWGYTKVFYAKSPSTGKNYDIELTHLDPGNPALNSALFYPSGTIIGNLVDDLDSPGRGHVHVVIAEDGVWKDADLYFRICR